ncbi:Mediator of RNA polymerase II transcription subunit 19a-like protein [Drosera capensis]
MERRRSPLLREDGSASRLQKRWREGRHKAVADVKLSNRTALLAGANHRESQARLPELAGENFRQAGFRSIQPHHEFFCKKTLPLSISDTHYLHYVVGVMEIRKGEGMQLDQLIKNQSYSNDGNVWIQPFDLDILGEAFHLRETASIELSPEDKGTPTIAGKSKEKEKKHKKHRDKDKEKDIEHKKHKDRHKDRNKGKDKDKEKDKEKKKDKSGHQDSSAEHS